MKHVFPHYQGKSLDDFEATTSSLERAVNITRDYIIDLKAMKAQGKGITFVGQNGVGKTHLACAVMSAVDEASYKYECIELDSYIGMYKEKFSLSTRISKYGYDEDGDQALELDERIRCVERYAQFLLLDDLGRETESHSGWSNHQVFNLLRYRYNRDAPTIITTNLPFPELDARYTEGLSSFLHEATILVVMEGEDYRCVGGK
jgi:DNA replication protein DnaC